MAVLGAELGECSSREVMDGHSAGQERSSGQKNPDAKTDEESGKGDVVRDSALENHCGRQADEAKSQVRNSWEDHRRKYRPASSAGSTRKIRAECANERQCDEPRKIYDGGGQRTLRPSPGSRNPRFEADGLDKHEEAHGQENRQECGKPELRDAAVHG